MKEALKLALEALEAADWYIDQLEMIVYCIDDEGTHENRAKVQAAITAIKEVLAPTSTPCEVQPEQEPVAWRLSNEAFDYQITSYDEEQANTYIKNGWHLIDVLYTTPPKRPWVGLTDEEIEEAYAKPTLRKMYQAIEAKLKEKNT